MKVTAKILRERLFHDIPKQSVSDWCQENLLFDEPDNRGPFRLLGREYIREPLDAWSDNSIKDWVAVFGTQLGKTSMLMGGTAWAIVNKPRRTLWVMPTVSLAAKFSRTREMPMLRKCKATRDLIPTGGQRRHDFKTLEMQIGYAIIDFTGSNSPSNISSTPCACVVQDEMEKFDAKDTGEADASNLADQRTKNAANAFRAKTSSPAMIDGKIWKALSKTDLRRRFAPCPHCQKLVVFIWNKQYTVFKLTSEEAIVRWDNEAKRADGTWDLDRVERSAAFICPHCQARILDSHKTWMDRNGIWRPTQEAAQGWRGWHLPSLWGNSPETSVGKLAVKFLQAKNSLEGLQGFINGDLAEPYMAQDTAGERKELVTARIEVSDTWKQVLTIDCQAQSPRFWYARGVWKDDAGQIVEAGSCEQWDELRTIQTTHKIPDVLVGIDSGYGAISDAEVYKNCTQYGQFLPKNTMKTLASGLKEIRGASTMFAGWMPCQSMPTKKLWKNKESGLLEPFNIQSIDPFIGTANAGQLDMPLFQFAADYFEDILDNMRKGVGGFKFSVSDEVNKGLVPVGVVYPHTSHIKVASEEDFWKHMNGHIKAAVQSKFSGMIKHQWIKRHSRWPDHILDCVRDQVALANFYGFFKINQIH